MNLQNISNEFELGSVLNHAKLTGGKVNISHDVTTEEGRFVFQNLNDVFTEDIITDYRKVQRYLRTNGVAVPVLLQTDQGAYHVTNDKGFWRVFEHIENDPVTETSPQIAFEAGAMLGRFHTIMSGSTFKPESKIPHFHDTPWYLTKMDCIVGCTDKDTTKVMPLFEYIQNQTYKYPRPENQVITLHGDPKFENMLYKDGKAIALLDLDTLMQGHALIDLGDGLRSWSKTPNGEFDPISFLAGIEGYHTEAPREYGIKEYLDLTKTITLELATRYLTDAVEESYFAWDDTKYASAHDHNIVRTQRTLKFFEELGKTKIRQNKF